MLLLSELALHALDLPQFDACRPDEASPWQPDPEAFQVLRAQVAIGPGRTNALGLRGPVVDEARTPGIARVLYVGDSTCWGLGVPLEQSFAFRAAALAEEALGAGVEVVNGCIPGHSSFQARVMLRRLLRYEPDVVVVYVGARNDVDRHRYFRDADIPARLARLDAAWHEVRVLRGLEAAFDGLYKKLLRKPLPHARRARVSPDAFRENLASLIDEASRSGAQSIVLMPPFSVGLLERYPLIPDYQRAMEEVSAETGASSVSLQPAFARRHEDQVYQEDGFHFNAEGHRLAARLLEAELASVLAGRPVVGAR